TRRRPHRFRHLLTQVTVERPMGARQVVEQEGHLQDIQLGNARTQVARGEVAHEHLPALHEDEEIGVPSTLVHDVPGDPNLDLARRFLYDHVPEAGEAPAMVTVLRSVSSDPELPPPFDHPGDRIGCRIYL